MEQFQNTRPLHLHVSACFEERGIQQYPLFLFNDMQISGWVFCNLAIHVVNKQTNKHPLETQGAVSRDTRENNWQNKSLQGHGKAKLFGNGLIRVGFQGIFLTSL